MSYYTVLIRKLHLSTITKLNYAIDLCIAYVPKAYPKHRSSRRSENAPFLHKIVHLESHTCSVAHNVYMYAYM